MGQVTFEMMLFASSGREVTLPTPAVCRDVFKTLMELEHVSGGKSRGGGVGQGQGGERQQHHMATPLIGRSQMIEHVGIEHVSGGRGGGIGQGGDNNNNNNNNNNNIGQHHRSDIVIIRGLIW